jgi:hypothetical protein
MSIPSYNNSIIFIWNSVDIETQRRIICMSYWRGFQKYVKWGKTTIVHYYYLSAFCYSKYNILSDQLTICFCKHNKINVLNIHIKHIEWFRYIYVGLNWSLIYVHFHFACHRSFWCDQIYHGDDRKLLRNYGKVYLRTNEGVVSGSNQTSYY